MLASDLDSSVEGDRAILELLVSELDIQASESLPEASERRETQLAITRLEMLVSELDHSAAISSVPAAPKAPAPAAPPVHERTNRRELQLVIMRLLSESRKSPSVLFP